MSLELERKFLVVGDQWRSEAGSLYQQAYICAEETRSVRIRIIKDIAFLAVKGRTDGVARLEFEYRVPLRDAQQMLEMRCGSIVEKHRHVVRHEDAVWEVDEFLGDNEGLVTAEISLTEPDQAITLPPWVGEEVTDDPRYLNSSLSVAPFRSWSAHF